MARHGSRRARHRLTQGSAPAAAPTPQGVRVWHQLHRSRIGLVGAPSEWLVASTPSAGAVASSWGPSLVDIDMQELLSKLWDGGHWEKGEVDQVGGWVRWCAHGVGLGASGGTAAAWTCRLESTYDGSTFGAHKQKHASPASPPCPPASLLQVVQDMLQGGGLVRGHAEVGEAGKAGGCPSCGVPATVDAEPAAKVYLALRQLVDAHALACCTVRCFDVVSAKETTGVWGGMGTVVKRHGLCALRGLEGLGAC